MEGYKSSWQQDAIDSYGDRVYSVDSLVSKESDKRRARVGLPSKNPSYTSACNKDLTIFGVVFNFYGIQLFDDHKAFARLPKFLLFSFAICLSYVVLLAMICSVAITEGLTVPSMRFAQTVVYNVLANVEIVWIYAVLYCRQHVIQEIFDHLSRISRDLVAEDSRFHRTVRRCGIAFAIAVVLLMVGSLVYTWMTMVFTDDALSSVPWHNLGLRHCLVDDCSDNYTAAAAAATTTTTTTSSVCFNNVHLAMIYSVDYLIRLPLYVTFVSFCMLLAYMLSGHFGGLLDTYGLGTDRDCTDSGHVHDLIQRHHALTKIVKLFDAVFQQPLFIWSLEEFVNVVFIVRTLNLHRGSDVATLFDGVVILSSIALFVLKLTFVSYMNKQVVSSLQGLTVTSEAIEYDETLGRPSSSMESHERSQKQRFVWDTFETISVTQLLIDTQIELYIRHVTLQPPAVSGMGLFTIYSGVILTACGQSLTYILALYGIPD